MSLGTKFNEALQHTLQFEGGYVNDPDDRGGETFRGISRKNWPNWAGWDRIDQVKRTGAVSRKAIDIYFNQDAEMEALVAGFYHENFWLPFQILNLPALITAKLFDTSINVGQKQAVKFLQRAVNQMNAAGPLVVDGAAGPKTIHALAFTLISPDDEQRMLQLLVRAQEEYYREIVRKRPNQQKYLKGWLRRAAWVPA
ncbi:hypothetical protein C4J81_16445 [Deltaproteobacteria bacterium Smac51]|nr:hypothetical protein C4J81_16445 [Deltaproteobacteria bacterium Smac51]